jgi:hypothetical protein
MIWHAVLQQLLNNFIRLYLSIKNMIYTIKNDYNFAVKEIAYVIYSTSLLND